MADANGNGAALRVTRIQESNFKRLVAADISPGNRSLVILRGANEAGKTSTIEGLIAALGGKRAAPAVPIREGAEAAVVEVTLGDGLRDRYRVARSWKAGKTYLHVYQIGEDGQPAKLTAGQTYLDSLIADLSFDPLAFARASAAQQIRLLWSAIGRLPDYEAAQQRRAALYEQRRGINATCKQLEAQAAAAPDPAPGEELTEITDADVAAQMQAAEQHNRRRASYTAAIDRHTHDAEQHDQEAARLAEQIAALRAEIDRRTAAAQQSRSLAAAAQQSLAQLSPAIDTAGYSAQIGRVRQHNDRVAQQRRARELAGKVREAAGQADALSRQIEAVDIELARTLEASDLGQAVPGLAVRDGQVMHAGLPLSQASGMRRLELSALIGMAANPRLRILTVDEGDQLDDASLARLIELAKARDYQVWMTAIRAGDEHDKDTHIVPVVDGRAVDGGGNGTASAAAPAAVAVGSDSGLGFEL